MPESLSGVLVDHATLYTFVHRREPPLETPHDASRLRCVARARIMRHEMSRINDLHRTHRATPNDARCTTTNDERKNPKTPGSRGADLSFVRPFGHCLADNLPTMNRLPLCPHNVDFLGLVRPSCLGNPHSFSHNPANDADLLFVRHLRRLLTNNPLTMSSLRLCPQKCEISRLLRHPSVRNPHSFPTTHHLPPTTQLYNKL
jgi:hypothetical protein